MKRSKRMQVVLDLARRDEEAAAESYEHAKRDLQGEVDQLNQTTRYYQEYASSSGVKGSQVNINTLEHSRLFLQRLSEIIELLKQQVALKEGVVQQKKDVWYKCHLRSKSLSDLIDRYKKEEEIEYDKKEQKVIDDWVTQAYNRDE